METERSIPKSIDYTDVLPVAVPAVARRRRFYPQNGTTFNANGTREIRIEIGSVNSLLDVQHSYLEFFVTNTSAQTLGFDIGGTNILFDEVRVEQGGRVLAREQEHARFHAGIVSPAQVSTDGEMTAGIAQYGKTLTSNVGGAAGMVAPFLGGNGSAYSLTLHNVNNQIPAGFSVRAVMAMPTGLFTQDKLLPLPLVSQNNPITLVLRMANSQSVGVWNAQPGNGALQIIRANYIAQLIEVGPDVIQQMKQMQAMSGGQLTISSHDIEHNQGLLPAGSAGEQIIRVPMRKRSVKSLLFQINSEDFTNGAAGMAEFNIYNLSSAGNANMNSYQLKVGSVVYPPQPVNCWGNCGRPAIATRSLPEDERGECAMELAKAFGQLGFTNPTGRMTCTAYGTSTVNATGAGNPNMADGDNGDGINTIAPASGQELSYTPFGLDLDAFQHTAIEAGVNTETLALETNLILNIDNAGGAGSGAEPKNVHTYVIYDKHYYFNADGNITFSE